MEQALPATTPAYDGLTGVISKAAASWPAIAAGAFVAVGSSLILISLGTGLGFALASPQSDHPVTTALVINAAIWLIVTQWVSAALGGYIAGRLRTRWLNTHTHEVFFRDTAHGLVTWAVATVLVAGFVGGTAHDLVNGGTHAASQVGAIAAQSTISGGMEAYDTDKLLRPANVPTTSAPGPAGADDTRVQVEHIVAAGLKDGHLSDDDRDYLTHLVAARTGLSAADAQQRVDTWASSIQQAQARIQAAAEATRKAASETAVYTALSLLIGAFVASVAAAVGGRLRDLHP
jgi:hypothetical protein